jgi:hypothetical protein
MVVQAVNEISKKVNSLSGQGQTERAETEKLIELQHHKPMILKILQTLHESLPVVEGALGQATTQQAVRDAITAAGAPPRGQRKQVFIESLDMQFEPDLRVTNWESRIGVKPPTPINEHDPNTGDELPGILIKITCTTPNEGGLNFIKDSFIEALRQNGRKPGAGFYIDLVVPVEGGKVEAATGAGSATPATGRTGPTRGGAARTGTSATPGATAGHPEKIDVVTLEPTDDDWRFEIRADAILQDFSEAGEKREKAPPPKSKPTPKPSPGPAPPKPGKPKTGP